MLLLTSAKFSLIICCSLQKLKKSVKIESSLSSDCLFRKLQLFSYFSETRHVFLAFFRLIRKDFSCQLSMETWREIRLQMIFLKLPSFFFLVRFFWRIPFCRGEKMSYLECKDTTTRTQHQAILYKL